MDKGPTRSWTKWVAVLAAYLTAFQLVFGGLGPASATSFDPTQILCGQAASSAPGTPVHPPAPAHHPDCCVLGCCAAAHGLGPIPTLAALPGHAVAATFIRLGRPSVFRVARSGYAPRQTRGPPAVG